MASPETLPVNSSVSGIGLVIETFQATSSPLAVPSKISVELPSAPCVPVSVPPKFFRLSVVRGAGYFAVGEFGRDALIAFAFAFPMMLLGIFIGDRFHGDMEELTFRRVIAVVLVVSGVALMAK